MTMAMGVRSGGIVMRMRMAIMTMRVAVTRLCFAGARKVVDEWDVHWGLLQQILISLRFCTRPARASMNSLVGYSSESEEEPPAKRRQAVYCFRDCFLLFIQETATYLPIDITLCTHR